jgi:hypothetical protein
MRGRGTVSLPPLTSGAPVLVKGSSCGLMPAVQGEPWVRQGLTQSQVEHIQLSRSIASLPKGGRAARPSNWLPSCCQQLGTSETDRCVCGGGEGAAAATSLERKVTYCRVTVWVPGIGRSISRSRRLRATNTSLTRADTPQRGPSSPVLSLDSTLSHSRRPPANLVCVRSHGVCRSG